MRRSPAAADEGLPAYEESAQPEETLDRRTTPDHRRRWMVATGAAIVIAGLALVVRSRLRSHASEKTAHGSIDWRLTVFSNNRLEFRPSLAIWPRSAHRTRSLHDSG